MPLLMTLKYIWRSFSPGCHFHVHFSYPWHAFASHGLPAIAELLVINDTVHQLLPLPGSIAIRHVCWCVCSFINMCWVRISWKRLETETRLQWSSYSYGHVIDDVTWPIAGGRAGGIEHAWRRLRSLTDFVILHVNDKLNPHWYLK